MTQFTHLSSPDRDAPFDGASLYEWRKYRVADGRLKEEIDRALACACTVEQGGKGLFARHGIPQPIGLWTILAGADQPCVVFLYRWVDAASRSAAFSSFYQDPEWIQLRAQSNGGNEIVDRLDDLLFVGPELRSVPSKPFYRFFWGDAAGAAETRVVSLSPLCGDRVETLNITAHTTFEAALQANEPGNDDALVGELSHAWPQ